MMNQNSFAALTLSTVAGMTGIAKATAIPSVTLSNGVLEVDILLPDKENYHGTRFDRSGMVDQVYWSAHTFFCDHNDTAHDLSSGCGMAEEFSIGICGLPGPLGYEEAKYGDGFLKIGVGVLEKDSDEGAYDFTKLYPVLNPGDWQVTHGEKWIEFIHEITDFKGWGYRYVKRVSLMEGRPELLIERRLENTGTNRIETTHYGHNFVLIDNNPIGESYTLSFLFEANVVQRTLREYINLNGDTLTFSDAIPEDEKIWAALDGFKKTSSDNCFDIENRDSGVGMRIQGELPLQRFHLYIEQSMLCPEPFVSLVVEPGESLEWETKYTFYELDK